MHLKPINERVILPFLSRVNVRLLCLSIVCAIMLFSVVSADAPPYAGAHPVQAQIRALLPEMRNSAAEDIMGAYVPGVGAMWTITVVRGENVTTSSDEDSAAKMRDWVIYLMVEFGGRLEGMVEGERVVFSADYYDYDINIFRQLAISCPANQTSDASLCAIWLDGQPFGGTAQ